MPGTLRWIMNGITLMPAPTIEQTPVAVRPARPISRARRGSVRPASMEEDIGGFYLLRNYFSANSAHSAAKVVIGFRIPALSSVTAA
jgi:hypothetical protein